MSSENNDIIWNYNVNVDINPLPEKYVTDYFKFKSQLLLTHILTKKITSIASYEDLEFCILSGFTIEKCCTIIVNDNIFRYNLAKLIKIEHINIDEILPRIWVDDNVIDILIQNGYDFKNSYLLFHYPSNTRLMRLCNINLVREDRYAVHRFTDFNNNIKDIKAHFDAGLEINHNTIGKYLFVYKKNYQIIGELFEKGLLSSSIISKIDNELKLAIYPLLVTYLSNKNSIKTSIITEDDVIKKLVLDYL